MKKISWMIFFGGILYFATVQSIENTPSESVDNTVYGSDLPFLKGAVIAIKAYDPKTKTYEVHSPTFFGEGDSHVTPEGLAKGLESIDVETILRNPTSVVGNQYQVDQEMPTLFVKEREARRDGAEKK